MCAIRHQTILLLSTHSVSKGLRLWPSPPSLYFKMCVSWEAKCNFLAVPRDPFRVEIYKFWFCSQFVSNSKFEDPSQNGSHQHSSKNWRTHVTVGGAHRSQNWPMGLKSTTDRKCIVGGPTTAPTIWSDVLFKIAGTPWTRMAQDRTVRRILGRRMSSSGHLSDDMMIMIMTFTYPYQW